MDIEEALTVTDEWLYKCRHLLGETKWTLAVSVLRQRIAELEAQNRELCEELREMPIFSNPRP